jgi:hypothetical protein
MDILCPRCGEPWDMDTLHDEAKERLDAGQVPSGWTYGQVYNGLVSLFVKRGCRALKMIGADPCERVDDERTESIRTIYAMMPGDLDGCAAMFEDMALV